MGKQPSAIIIVRHGTRLDQADKTWRATAEHPYDPPLSYGGWIQCQTLGARIDRELRGPFEQTTDSTGNEEDDDPSPRPAKRRKIIIHSSPYKRCIQTSIAIAAGLRYPPPESLRPLPTPFQRTSISQVRGSIASSAIYTEPPRSQPADDSRERDGKPGKSILKVDPFLGEWLSPSYFEDSKPPPSTDIILERAKETMTKPLVEIRGADLNAFLPVPESPDAADAEKENEFRQAVQEKGGLRAMAAAGHSLPHRTRTTSFAIDRMNGMSQMSVQKLRQRAGTTNVYSPPVPQYSLAPQDPIPAGYVAHARDGCVLPDLAWNSEEMGWGDSGVYPEEWSTMHVRFRLGLQKMLSYYENLPVDGLSADSDNDSQEDVVLVLVTHQAGANALIRLVTGAPALHDVGVASLTLAVRRPVLRRLPSLAGTSHSPLGYDRDSRRASRRGSLDLGLADDFEMRVIASTEHLRSGSNPLGLNSPRLGRSPAMSGRRLVGADSLEGFSIGDPLGWRPNSSGGVFRIANQRSRGSGDGAAKSAANTGLWGSPAATAVVKDPIEEAIEDLTPMSPKSRPATPSVTDTDSIPEEKLSSPTRSRSSTVQSAGLWGGSGGLGSRAVPGEGMWGNPGQSRARSPAKRRWTAVSTDS